jgi:hypothetical protein
MTESSVKESQPKVGKMYIVETPKDIFWSIRKMDAQFLHATKFLYKDKAKYKEVTSEAFESLIAQTKKKVRKII